MKVRIQKISYANGSDIYAVQVRRMFVWESISYCYSQEVAEKDLEEYCERAGSHKVVSVETIHQEEV